MAWLKCQNTKPVPPIPTTVFSNSFYRSAQPVSGGGTIEIDGYHIPYNKQEVIDTRNVVSMTIVVNYSLFTYASGGYPDDGPPYTWESTSDNQCSFRFAVNGTDYLNTPVIEVRSVNDGRVSQSGSATFTITGFPRGNCEFDYNIWLESCDQNGGQLDPNCGATITFQITNVVYK